MSRTPPLRQEPLRTALAAWYSADDHAREIERRVREASHRREADGTPVPQDLLREMLRARSEANALLREAIALANPPARAHPERGPSP